MLLRQPSVALFATPPIHPHPLRNPQRPPPQPRHFRPLVPGARGPQRAHALQHPAPLPSIQRAAEGCAPRQRFNLHPRRPRRRGEIPRVAPAAGRAGGPGTGRVWRGGRG